MQQDIQFCNREIVRIRHFKTKAYLQANQLNMIVREGILLKKNNLGHYLVGSQELTEDLSLWAISKYQTLHEDLYYGDLVYIQNKKTNEFIYIDKNKKSETTKQALVYMVENQPNRPLLLQRSTNQGELNCLIGNQPVRIIDTDNNLSLHSHKEMYKQLQMFQEVTGFHQRDPNDFWEIIKTEQPNLGFKMSQTLKLVEPPSIIDKDVLIIRNLWSGLSLHSHNIKYKTSKCQEVTGMCLPRDDNDKWAIYKSEGQNDDEIVTNSMVQIRHIESTKYLRTLEQFTTQSECGLQATCDQFPYDWIIETLDGKTLSVEKPFYIKDTPKEQYLANVPFPSETTKHQQEIALVKHKSPQCLWIVEERKAK